MGRRTTAAATTEEVAALSSAARGRDSSVLAMLVEPAVIATAADSEDWRRSGRGQSDEGNKLHLGGLTGG